MLNVGRLLAEGAEGRSLPYPSLDGGQAERTIFRAGTGPVRLMGIECSLPLWTERSNQSSQTTPEKQLDWVDGLGPADIISSLPALARVGNGEKRKWILGFDSHD